MRKLFVSFFMLCLLVVTGVAAQDAETEGGLPDLGGRTITVAVENAYKPFNFLDEEGNAVGWDYDVLNYMCSELLNCVPEYIETSWDGMIVAVSNGEYDMAADGITINEERRELVERLLRVLVGNEPAAHHRRRLREHLIGRPLERTRLLGDDGDRRSPPRLLVFVEPGLQRHPGRQPLRC